MLVKYRNSSQIVINILECTQEEIKIGTLIRKTNTNHIRLRMLLEKLTNSQLVVKFEKDFLITKKGREYLESYKKFTKLANSFGLDL